MNATLKRILQARTALLYEAPFFGALALRLKLQEDASCDTAWTDGRSIGYNPAFVDGLTPAELTGLLVHEVMHVASGHPWRRGAREPRRANIAMDYAINGALVEAGFQLPDGGLLDAQYTGHAFEWIYDRLPESAGRGSPQAGEVRDAPTDPDEDGTPAPTEQDWKQAVQQAAQVAKAYGQLPGGMERFASATASPRVDWRSVLHRFAQEAAKADYSWTRPAPRYLARGMYLPALHSAQIGRIAVAVDVSGSVDDVLLAQFSAEINAIVRELEPAGVDVLYCDAELQRRDSFEVGDPVELRSCGGGGTDFRPVFEALEGEEPVFLVYLTDLYGTFPEEAPAYPVLWGATSSAQAPFGELVRME